VTKTETNGRHLADAPDLERILWRVHELGLTNRVSLTVNKDGRWEASKDNGNSSFRIAVQDNPVDALKEVLGPQYNGTWEEHLKLDEEF
jgi:hypothetical protein